MGLASSEGDGYRVAPPRLPPPPLGRPVQPPLRQLQASQLQALPHLVWGSSAARGPQRRSACSES
eukprot:9474567-Pyramimonas_sp.AAC.1